MATAQRLARLRCLIDKPDRWMGGPLQALIIPSEDSHQSEYVAHCFERRAFISGFTGSSGCAVVTESQAALWTDGRYFAQAERQLDPSHWILMKQAVAGTPTQEEWLSKVLPAQSRVGVDAYVMSYGRFRELGKALKRSGHTLVALDTDAVDEVWEDQPPLPHAPVVPLPIEFAGEAVAAKVQAIRDQMVTAKCRVLLLAALDEVAWLTNLRGGDVEFNPTFYAYAMVTDKDFSLYIDEARLTPEARAHLANADCALRPYAAVAEDVSRHVAEGARVWVGDHASYGLVGRIPKQALHVERTPACTRKAIKNAVELAGARAAHVRDGAALCAFLAWLETRGLSEEPALDECTAADRLEQFRKQQQHYVGPSFATISGYGPNGAIIHYRAEPTTAARIADDNLYLVDSGAQYLDGTTDVTRTVHLGVPSAYQRQCFTAVLKGHIALARAVFPAGTTGHAIDALARVPLWRLGRDYKHGTGHGVGAYLNVHEGPHMITMRADRGAYGLAVGMLSSNEPGYYEDGAFGIRCENVVEVVEAATESGADFLTFKDLTMAPFQAVLIDTAQLSSDEVAWVDQYHATVRDAVAPVLRDQGLHWAVDWLLAATQPLARS